LYDCDPKLKTKHQLFSTFKMEEHRPFDELGPSSDPIAFPPAQFVRGYRDKLLCYNPTTGEHEFREKVLFSDLGRHAYWPVKRLMDAIMGHVELCRVLERQVEDDDSDDNFQLTERLVAVKVNYKYRMELYHGRYAESPWQEISAMQLLGENPVHVLGAIEVLDDGKNLNLVMNYCDSGDFFRLLYENPNRSTPGLCEAESRYWFRQVMDGVKFLHSRGICHRDLSPENIMIDRRDGVIIDMGLCLRVPYIDPNQPNESTVRTDISNGSTRCLFNPQGQHGKKPYMSPEIYANQTPFDGAAVDVWASGAILFCMITGDVSYRLPRILDQRFEEMTDGLRQFLSDQRVNMSEEGINLLQGMLQIEPRNRLTIEEVRNHPWFAHPDEQPILI
jgi:serine/threonine protein kinase